MLRRIRIKNFQKHRKLDAEIDRLTCFVGESDVGKSAIIRAIGWVLFNKPTGIKFISHGKSETRVRLDFDGFGVTRVRSAKVNEYLLHRKGKTKRLVSFKNSPPDIVLEYLNMNGVNLQYQFESPFWLGLNEMQVSRVLNEVVNLQSLDSARDKLNGMIREHNLAIRVADSSLSASTQLAKRLEKYNDGQLQLKLKDVERAITIGIKDDAIADQLEDLIQALKEGDAAVIKAENKKLELVKLLSIEDTITSIERSRDEAAELFALIQNCEEASSECQDLATRLSEVTTELKEFKLCPKCKNPLQ